MVNLIFMDISGTMIEPSSTQFDMMACLMNCHNKEKTDYIRKEFNNRSGKIYQAIEKGEMKFLTTTEIYREVLNKMAEQCGLPNISEKSAEIIHDVYVISSKLYDDARPALEELAKRGKRVIAVTDGERVRFEEALKHHGINPYFERLIVADDPEVQSYKPSAIIANVMNKLCLPSDKKDMVGDSERCDCGVGKLAGTRTILLDRSGRILEHHADIKIKSLMDYLMEVD